MSTMNFAYSYAKVHVTAFTVVGSRSGRVRTFAERTMLELFYNRMAAVSLSGYIFFGSSVNISRQVHEVCCLGAVVAGGAAGITCHEAEKQTRSEQLTGKFRACAQTAAEMHRQPTGFIISNCLVIP